MYDESFYKCYEKYLQESSVREAHDWVFSILDERFQRVIDLGCGQFHEFLRFAYTTSYFGVDVNTPISNFTIAKDYRRITADEIPDDATAFVSLFSTEITAPEDQNTIFYKFLLAAKNLQVGLISGFYYTDKLHESSVSETGGIRSFQTSSLFTGSNFREKRILIPVPSVMFGPNVIEVWRILEKL